MMDENLSRYSGENDVDVEAVESEKHSATTSLGRLVDESRRVLVALLQGPFLDGRKDNVKWAQLLRDRVAIETRLADMYLELVIDDDAQVAFVRQSEDDSDAPKLLRRLSTLNRLDSVLLLILRQHLLTQASRGQRAVVNWRELESALEAYRRTNSTDEAGFKKEIRASITKIQKAGLLEEQGDSFEVSPVLRLMITPDVAREFLALYEAENLKIDGDNLGTETDIAADEVDAGVVEAEANADSASTAGDDDDFYDAEEDN